MFLTLVNTRLTNSNAPVKKLHLEQQDFHSRDIIFSDQNGCFVYIIAVGGGGGGFESKGLAQTKKN
jgi:hypothetical protein